MDVAGAQIASLVQRPDSSSLGLQLHQRFAAEVLNVAGDQVTLVLEGTPFVARLINAEQAAALQGQRYATFQVKEYSPTLVQLQLITTSTPTNIPTPKTASTLIPNLLRLAGLPADENNIMIAQALIKEGLPVNADIIFDLRNVLANIQGWGQAHANQAAALKAAALPLTPQALLLAMQQEQQPSLVDMLKQLTTQLERATQENPQHSVQIRQMLSLFNQLSVDWSGNEKQLAEQLRQSITLMSRPLERDLAQFLKNNLPLLNTLEGQAAFEQELTKLIQGQLSFLSTEERVSFQNEFLQLIARSSAQLNTPEGQAIVERELVRLIQNRVPFLHTPDGQASFGLTLSNLIQNNLPLLSTTDGLASFEQSVFSMIQNYAQLSKSPEEFAAFQKQLSQLIQMHVNTLSTPQGQSVFERELAQLIQRFSPSQNLEGEGEAAMNQMVKDNIPLATFSKGSGVEKDIALLLQNNFALLKLSSQKDSLESEIARLIQDKTQFLTSPEGQAKMVQLARLRNELGGGMGMGMDAVLKDVDTLMERMRWIQLENVPTQSAPFKEQWLTLELPLTTMQGETQQPMVKLRVAYQSKDKNRKIDPNNTHIMLHFDLGVQDESIDVDMAIVERKIGAQVIVSNQVLQPIAEDEMSTLADGLKELGYLLQTARCDLAHPKRASLSEIQSTSTYPENPLGSYNLRA